MGTTIYTIGFAGRTAQSFFEDLASSGVRSLLDIRLRPDGQLAGFAKRQDLPFFLQRLVDGCAYRHLPELAPTDAILKTFRAEKDWDAYVTAFEALMDERNIPGELDPTIFGDACLLCSEATVAQCHRRLVAERLARAWPGTEIRHL
ncbi:MAG: DUF488 domain-containing protein [Armatimonadetes bacterium]|nr:DUF488 domain-containing protein [Armatimonadota bacterium]